MNNRDGLHPDETVQRIKHTAGQSNAIILSECESSAAKEIMTKTQERLEFLKAELIRIQNEFEEETAGLSQLQVAVAPHKRLPVEVLTNIFRLTLDSDDSTTGFVKVPPCSHLGRLTGFWAIRQVSSSWRKIVINCHSLWSCIAVGEPDVPTEGLSGKRWKRHLNTVLHVLPSTGPLELALVLPSTSNGSMIRAAMKRVVAPYVRRITTLRILAAPSDLEEFFRSKPRILRHLKELEIDQVMAYRDEDSLDEVCIRYWKSRPIFREASHLQQLELEGCRSFFRYMGSLKHGPWVHLTHLQIKAGGYEPIHFSDIIPVLKACENLRTADLYIPNRSTYVDFRPVEVTLPRLEKLRLTCSDSCPFTSLNLPALTELAIVRGVTLYLADITEMIARSSCKLTTFKEGLYGTGTGSRPLSPSNLLKDDDVLHFFRTVPSLTCLVTTIVLSEEVIRNVVSGQVLPSLGEFLALSDIPVDNLRSILKPRAESGGIYTHMYLHYVQVQFTPL